LESTLPHNTFILLGPTAVGKTDLAVTLAERIDGEIVGADAFQVYEGLDILSAKPGAELRKRVPHHLIGEFPLTAEFDVAQYRSIAMDRAWEIARRGKIPILCGGAGMYARALTHGLADTPPADPAIRAELASQPLESLVARLKSLDPNANVDERNPRRVIRAVEICLASGRPFSTFRQEWTTQPQFSGAILTRSRESLHARIAKRTRMMFDAGVLEEVRAVKELSRTAAQMLGLREIRAHLAGELSREACESAIIQATRQYAKRQLTWFRREQGYRWIELDTCKDPVTLLEQLASRAQK
jgi:tRNA dimethylallyltransferase